MLTILQVDPATQWRGGQVQTRLLVDGLLARGHRVILAAPEQGELAKRCGAGVELRPIPAGAHPATALALARLVRRLEVDVVAVQTSQAHGLAVLAGLSPVVHRRVDFQAGQGLLSRWKYRRARLFIAVSEGVARVLRSAGVEPWRVRVVHDGVRPVRKGPPAADLIGDWPLVGAVGALVPHKGHRFLVEALGRLPGVRGVIVGEGPLRPTLETQIRALGLAERVQLLGYRGDIPEIFAALDLLVHPSVEEGLGQVVVEAMSARVPVCCTSAGGLPETIGPERHCVRPGDPVALAHAIREALDSPASPEMLDAAQARATSLFSPDRMVEGTLAAYQEAAQSKTGRLEPLPAPG